MKKVLFLVLTGIVVVSVLLGVQASIERANTTARNIEDYQKEEGIPVVTAKAELAYLKSTMNYTGSIKGIEQADVTSTLQIEKILEIHVKPGQHVRKNQLLVTLDNRITANYRRISDGLADAKQDQKRIDELFKAGAVSQQSLDKANLGLSAAQAEYDALIGRHKVASPISGIVTDIFVEKAQTVSAGIPLVRVAKLDRVFLEIQIAESERSLVRSGQKALVIARPFADHVFEGTVTEAALSTNSEARNFKTKIEIPNPGKMLKPGMFAEADLIISEAKNAVAIPKDALVSDNGSYYVFVVQSDNRVKMVPVTPGISEGTLVEIPEGISSGDNVVVEGQNKLSDGVKITVVS